MQNKDTSVNQSLSINHFTVDYKVLMYENSCSVPFRCLSIPVWTTILCGTERNKIMHVKCILKGRKLTIQMNVISLIIEII